MGAILGKFRVRKSGGERKTVFCFCLRQRLCDNIFGVCACERIINYLFIIFEESVTLWCSVEAGQPVLLSFIAIRISFSFLFLQYENFALNNLYLFYLVICLVISFTLWIGVNELVVYD